MTLDELITYTLDTLNNTPDVGRVVSIDPEVIS